MVDRLTADGLQVFRSFDLKSAWEAHTDCACPHHGNEDCECQLVVLLVYDDSETMLTLVVHSKDNKTHFALVDSPTNKQEKELKLKILQAVALEGFSALRH
jgi:hypothetical protein